MTITVEGSPPPGTVGDEYYTKLTADGGTPPYQWTTDPPLPDGLELAVLPGSGQQAVIRGVPTKNGPIRATINVTDSADDTAPYEVYLNIDPKRRWWQGLFNIGNWLALLALGVPMFGSLWIVIYAFGTPGPHWSYLGIAMSTAIAAFLTGCLIGFLFGIPRVVSSGQLRHDTGQFRRDKGSGLPAPSSNLYTPSSNLAEVSDWLTKLLLGAGLVQLTRLGPPISQLIDSVAAGLAPATAAGGANSAAKVMAGAILFGYVAIGMLDAYVVTTVWYQNKLTSIYNESRER
jgi:hypothetical protein